MAEELRKCQTDLADSETEKSVLERDVQAKDKALEAQHKTSEKLSNLLETFKNDALTLRFPMPEAKSTSPLMRTRHDDGKRYENGSKRTRTTVSIYQTACGDKPKRTDMSWRSAVAAIAVQGIHYDPREDVRDVVFWRERDSLAGNTQRYHGL